LAIESIVYLTVEEAITLHILLMRTWEEVHFGIDRKDVLESALNRPKHSATYETADLVRQSATLCFGLIKNDPWLGGNKRTATFLMEVFLEMNDHSFVAQDKSIVDMALMVESDSWNVDEIEKWLKHAVEKIHNA
jgi:death on curing protein